MSKPKLALIPSGYKSGKVYSILPNDATGDFDFTRQSIGTRVRKDGLIEEAKTVGSITNELLYSEEFTGLNWTNVNTTITADQELAPNGTNTADKIARTSTSGSYTAHTISKSTTAKKFTTSVYLKKGSHDYFALRTQGSYPSRVDIRFRFDTEQIYYAQTVSNFTLYDYGVEVLANDWYRLHYTYETDTHSNISVSFSPRSTDGNIDNTDTSSTAHAFVWGAMVSEGALSDYIKTEGTTETKTVETFTDVPRLDWYNSNCPSLLLEPQRTNAFTYSQDFSNSNWAKTEFTISSNEITAPDGTLTASELFETSASSGKFLHQNTSVTTGNDYTISYFVKYQNKQFIQLTGSTGFDIPYVNFDILNGEIVRNLDNADARIEDFGNGWYRISLTLEATSTTSGRILLVGIRAATSLRAESFTGDTSNSYYIWGGQMEQGSYPTSYIKTEASAVTRLKDECLNGGDSDLFNITEGTFFVDITPFTYEAFSTITLNDGSSNNFISIVKLNATQFRLRVTSGGVVQAQIFPTITYNIRNKFIITFKENQFKFYINGSLVSTDISGIVPTGLSELSFNYGNNTAEFTGKVHDTRVYDRVLTEAEAIELTTL